MWRLMTEKKGYYYITQINILKIIYEGVRMSEWGVSEWEQHTYQTYSTKAKTRTSIASQLEQVRFYPSYPFIFPNFVPLIH